MSVCLASGSSIAVQQHNEEFDTSFIFINSAVQTSEVKQSLPARIVKLPNGIPAFLNFKAKRQFN